MFMKKSFLSIILSLMGCSVWMSCTSHKNIYQLEDASPIVDYSGSYEQIETRHHLIKSLDTQKSTLILLNGKPISLKELSTLPDDYIHKLDVIKEPQDIQNLGYTYPKTKAVILVKTE